MSSDNVILFDGYCSFCRTAQRAVVHLDWLRLIQWLPFQSPGAERFGFSPEALRDRMYMISGQRRWSGFAAWKQILLRLPATYLVIGASCVITPYALLGWLLFFVPLTEPMGERVYDWIARNRYRFPGSTCQMSHSHPVHGMDRRVPSTTTYRAAD